MERSEQLSILLKSLWKLQWFEDCYIWAEACLDEAWRNYINAYNIGATEEEKKKWVESTLNCLEKLIDCTNQVSTFVVSYLSKYCYKRLVQNLIHIVAHQTDVSELGTGEVLIETVSPWILLHYILVHEEDKERSKKTKDVCAKSKKSESESEDEDEDIPASLMVLFTGHEFCGRRECCTADGGKLLLFTVKTIVPHLRWPPLNAIKDKISKYIEQIFFCLYEHLKKPKKQIIEDHNAKRIELTWEMSQLLFEFYRPEILPNIIGPGVITQDIEALLKRILRLMPAECDPNFMYEEMTDYFIGIRKTRPTVKKALPESVSSIFYLLGEYNFKSNTWSRAIR